MHYAANWAENVEVVKALAGETGGGRARPSPRWMHAHPLRCSAAI